MNANGSWNVELLRDFFVTADVNEILKIRASPRMAGDVIAWGPGRHGSFSVKSAYELAFDEDHRGTMSSSSASPSGRRACWDFIWKCDAPPSVKHFAWRLAIDALPTWQKKHRIGLETTSICPVCGTEEEDNFHPFVRCQLGRDLFVAMSKVWRLPDITSILNNGKEWLLHVLNPLTELERTMVLMIFWRSWFVRNELTHAKPAPPMEVSTRFLQKLLCIIDGYKAKPTS